LCQIKIQLSRTIILTSFERKTRSLVKRNQLLDSLVQQNLHKIYQKLIFFNLKYFICVCKTIKRDIRLNIYFSCLPLYTVYTFIYYISVYIIEVHNSVHKSWNSSIIIAWNLTKSLQLSCVNLKFNQAWRKIPKK